MPPFLSSSSLVVLARVVATLLHTAVSVPQCKQHSHIESADLFRIPRLALQVEAKHTNSAEVILIKMPLFYHLLVSQFHNDAKNTYYS